MYSRALNSIECSFLQRNSENKYIFNIPLFVTLMFRNLHVKCHSSSRDYLLILITFSMTVSFFLILVIVFESRILQYVYAQTISNSTNNYLTYDKNGIRIKYPSEWTVNDTEVMGGFVIFYSPSSADLIPSVLISIHPTDAVSPAIVFSNILDSANTSRSFNLISERTFNIKGNLAFKVVYTIQDEALGALQEMNEVVVNGDSYYVIRYYAHPGDYFYFLPSVENMISSFEITNTTPKHPLSLPSKQPQEQTKVTHNADEQTLSSTTKQRSSFGINIPQIKVGHNPTAIAVNPDTNTIYVANQKSDTVSVIHGTSMNVTFPLCS